MHMTRHQIRHRSFQGSLSILSALVCAIFLFVCRTAVAQNQTTIIHELSSAPEDIIGRWKSADSIIRISHCGDRLCGTVDQRPNRPGLGEDKDRFNPDKRLRGRSLYQVKIMEDLVPNGDYWIGNLYIPASGFLGTSVIYREGPNLKVGICASSIDVSSIDNEPRVCRWETWPRAR